MRCFIAVAVPDEVRARLVRVQESLRRADADVKWTEPENLHFTVKFLGDLEDGKVEELKRLVAGATAGRPVMAIAYQGVGTFPDRGEPRVVWAGAAGDLDAMASLAAEVERAAVKVGVEPERRPFRVHLTLGRVRSDRNAKRLVEAVRAQQSVALGADTVTELVFYRSTLTPKGSIYEAITRFPLGGA